MNEVERKEITVEVDRISLWGFDGPVAEVVSRLTDDLRKWQVAGYRDIRFQVDARAQSVSVKAERLETDHEYQMRTDSALDKKKRKLKNALSQQKAIATRIENLRRELGE